MLLLVMLVTLSLPIMAEEIEKEAELKSYITEKIVPVVAGVLTAIIALITTLGSVFKALSSLKDTKELFSNEAQDRAKSFEEYTKMLEQKAQELRDIVKGVPELEKSLQELKGNVVLLINECKALAEISSLGFSSSKDIIKSGKGKEMSLLVEKIKELISEREDTGNEEKQA